jgi:hypothetical protein
MSSLLLPGDVAREIQKKKWAELRAFHRAQLDQLFDFDDPVTREWNPELQRLDPLLRLGRARPKADPASTGLPVRPGFYHWIRENDTAAPTMTAITGPDGEGFAYPSSGVLEDLRRSDLQNPAIFRALLARQAARERDEEQAKLDERKDRRQEFSERWKAVSRTQVSMNTDTPWAQNAAGYQKVRGQKKRG